MSRSPLWQSWLDCHAAAEGDLAKQGQCRPLPRRAFPCLSLNSQRRGRVRSLAPSGAKKKAKELLPWALSFWRFGNHRRLATLARQQTRHSTPVLSRDEESTFLRFR